MSLMTEDKYIESLRNMHTRVFMFGEQIHNFVDHPIIRPSIHSVAMTYRLAQDPDYSDLMTVISPYTNEVINRFTHIHQSTQDLMNKVRMQRVMGQKTAACFQRCVGMDAINAVYSTTYEIDQKYGTDYFQRFKKYLMFIQKNDLMIDGAMTDPKGDRGKAPSEQSDPDMYLHIVSRSERGIVINGAKAHQTGAVNSHEILIMPTISMQEGDKEYAVCCSTPSDADGITMIYGRQSCDTRKMEEPNCMDCGNCHFGGQEALIVFDHVLSHGTEYLCVENMILQACW